MADMDTADTASMEPTVTISGGSSGSSAGSNAGSIASTTTTEATTVEAPPNTASATVAAATTTMPTTDAEVPRRPSERILRPNVSTRQARESIETVYTPNSYVTKKFWADIESMDEIEKSPYEANESAEVGEPLFDEIKALLASNNDNSDQAQNAATKADAAKIFGGTLSGTLLTAYDLIGKSGMLYSNDWQHGKIRSLQIGYIPKTHLLLCLHEQRILRANETLLTKVTHDLETAQCVKEMLVANNWEEKFIKLAANPSHFFYKTDKRDNRKSEVFVARATRCIVALKKTSMDDSIKRKVLTCLERMNSSVRVSAKDLAAAKEEIRHKKQKLLKKLKKGKIVAKPKRRSSRRNAPDESSSDSKDDESSSSSSSDGASSSEMSSNDGPQSKRKGKRKLAPKPFLNPVATRRRKKAGNRKPRGDIVATNANNDSSHPISASDSNEDGSSESLTTALRDCRHQCIRMNLALQHVERIITQRKNAIAEEVKEEVRGEFIQELIASGYLMVGHNLNKSK